MNHGVRPLCADKKCKALSNTVETKKGLMLVTVIMKAANTNEYVWL